MEFKKSILLIGDNREELGWLTEAFKDLRSSLEYIYAETAGDGLRILKRRYVDMVFIKYALNGNDGLFFLSAVKYFRKFRRLRIFLLGEQLGEEQVKMARRLGAAGCIESKNDMSALRRELKAILDPQLLPGFVFFARRNNEPLLQQGAQEVITEAIAIDGAIVSQSIAGNLSMAGYPMGQKLLKLLPSKAVAYIR